MFPQLQLRPLLLPFRGRAISSATAQVFGSLKDLSVDVNSHASSGVAVVTLDVKGESVNSLNLNLIDQFSALTDAIESDDSIRAVVFTSGKPNSFIAGADIRMFKEHGGSKDDILNNIIIPANKTMNKLAKGKPKVAAINGTCLGGGLEFALACHYRVVADIPQSTLGLPEVMLGLIPGCGGTQRLPALVGAFDALPLLMTGKNVNPKKAKRMKLVDEVADPHALMRASVEAAAALADGSRKPAQGPSGITNFLVNNTSLLDYAIEFDGIPGFRSTAGVRKQTLALTKGVYPAPLKILDVVKASVKGGGFGSEEGFAAEAEAFSELAVTDESKALRSIFFADKAAKKNPLKDKAPKVPFQCVGVVGAGLMGAGIAEVTVAKNVPCVLMDANTDGLAKGLQQIEGNLNQKVRRKRLSAFDRDQKLSSLVGVTQDDEHWKTQLGRCSIVVEAVPEILDLKHRIIQTIEENVSPSCVIATNTSAIPISEIAKGSSRPKNLLGMHYFSPVNKMQLLEIITHEGTSQEATSAAFELGLKQGKCPIVVKDVPGFYINRCLGPYADEAIALLQDGVDFNRVDRLLVQYGFPVGPMTLVDQVGIDVASSLPKNLKGDLGIRVSASNPAILAEIVDSNMLGAKTGSGMFLYENGKVKRSDGGKAVNEAVQDIIKRYPSAVNSPPVEDEDVQLRIVLRFLNEAAYCLQDSIISSPTVGDIGAVYGIGFMPNRGGPFQMMDYLGIQNVVDRMQGYADVLGDHFVPAPLLKDMARQGKSFH